MDILFPHAENGNTPERHCKGCQKTYPATPEFFPPEKKGKYGLSSRCRECTRARYARYRNKPEVHERHVAYMKQYHSRPDVQEQQRAYHARSDIRERENTYQRTYQKSPKARERLRLYYQRPEVQARLREFYNTPEQKERTRLRMNAYLQRPDVQEYRRAYGQAYQSLPEVQARRSAWYKARYQRREVQERYHTARRNRRARVKLARGSHSAEQIREQYARQRGTCYYCHKKVKWGEHHIDHAVPLSRGGTNDISNLVIACAHCNLSKNKKLPHEFYEGGRLL